jgi:hypothetical protein
MQLQIAAFHMLGPYLLPYISNPTQAILNLVITGKTYVYIEWKHRTLDLSFISLGFSKGKRQTGQ